ncbi:MAG: hypothetical protein HYX22_03085 [Candidatus Yanofskybacteria bacterium]|nr:hypothetical protein [Candidatus Yanofskybacteria bacterium]
MVKCVQPNAPWVKCCICKKRIKTCERKKPVGKLNDYTCPVHDEGCQLQNGKWVCSFMHWEIAIKKYYGTVV